MSFSGGPAPFDGVSVEIVDEKIMGGKENSAPIPKSTKRRSCPPCWTLFLWSVPLVLAALIGAGIALGAVAGKNGGLHCSGDNNAGEVSAAASHEDFDWQRSQFFPQFNFTANVFKHRNTGAEVLSIRSSDINKAAALLIRTPAEDSTGTPHVMMHSALMGSKNYPTTNPGPFFRLDKDTLNTYINGIIYADSTLLPVASTNVADFHNLIKVYIDGVFHPLVLEQPLLMKSEGWHLALEDASKPEDVSLEGVVVSKVRRSMSKPSARLQLLMQELIFPDNAYKNRYLGTLQDIPNMTPESFNDYYHRHYNPSNTRFFFYGDDNEYQRLELLSEALKGYSMQATNITAVKPQIPFRAPKQVVDTYPGSVDDGSYVVNVWMFGTDSEGVPIKDQLPLQILNQLLLGSRTSRLFDALLTTEVGTPISGLDEDFMQWVFHVGLQNVDASNETALGVAANVTLDKLEEIVRYGFSDEEIEAAIFTTEIKRKMFIATERDTGVNLVNYLHGAWVHDRDIFDVLSWGKQFDILRQRVASGERVFEKLIIKYLLANPHRVDLVFSPDPEQSAREEAEMKTRLQELLRSQGAEQVVAETKALQAFEQKEDSLEDIAKLPQLKLSEIDDPVEDIPQEIETLDDSGVEHAPSLLLHRQPTSGLLFVTIGLNITSDVDQSTVHLLPLLVTAMRHVDPNHDRLIKTITGGLNVGINVDSPQHGINQNRPYIMLEASSSSQEDKAVEMMQLLVDVLVNTDVHMEKAEAIMRREIRNSAKNAKVALRNNAYGVVRTRAKAQLYPEAWIEDQLSGISYMEHIMEWDRRLQAEADGGKPGAWEDLQTKLEKLRSMILGEARVVMSLTGDNDLLQRVRSPAKGVLQSMVNAGLSHTRKVAKLTPWTNLLTRQHEAIVTPSESGNMLVYGADVSKEYVFNGAAMAAEAILSDHLTTKVRKEGGAFGSSMGLQDDGYLTFRSWLDPKLHETVSVFRDTSGLLRNFTSSLKSRDREERETAERALTGAIIGAVRDNFPYLGPTQKARLAYKRFLRDTSVKELQSWKTSLLRTKAKDLDKVADAIDGGNFTLVAAISETAMGELQAAGVSGSSDVRFDSYVTDLLDS